MTIEDKKQRLIEFLSTKDLMFTIYHIPGVKVGCDFDIKRELNRPKQQGFEEWEILHQTKDIFEASELEKKEQKERNLKIDGSPYWNTFSSNIFKTDETCDKISSSHKGKNITQKHLNALNSGKKDMIITEDYRLKLSKGATNYLESEIGKKEIKKRAKETWSKRIPLTCKNCGRSISYLNMSRHINACERK